MVECMNARKERGKESCKIDRGQIVIYIDDPREIHGWYSTSPILYRVRSWPDLSVPPWRSRFRTVDMVSRLVCSLA